VGRKTGGFALHLRGCGKPTPTADKEDTEIYPFTNEPLQTYRVLARKGVKFSLPPNELPLGLALPVPTRRERAVARGAPIERSRRLPAIEEPPGRLMRSGGRTGSMPNQDGYVDRVDVPVLRVRADMKGRGPSEAFATLESRLPSLKGRKFFGSFRPTEDGEEYFACVGRIPSDDPIRMELGDGVIPGGLYVRRKLVGSEENIPHLAEHFDDLRGKFDHDPTRPSLEFYRSERELRLLLPVRSRNRLPLAESEPAERRGARFVSAGRSPPLASPPVRPRPQLLGVAYGEARV
jgi:hypothetical protein